MSDKYFPLPLIGKFVGKGQWQLLEPFEYVSDTYKKVEVPSGFISDGASIPRLFFTIIGSPWEGEYAEGSIIHDWLYSIKYNRKESDLIFLETMEVCGVPLWKRRIMYRALRLFGWISFRK